MLLNSSHFFANLRLCTSFIDFSFYFTKLFRRVYELFKFLYFFKERSDMIINQKLVNLKFA